MWWWLLRQAPPPQEQPQPRDSSSATPTAAPHSALSHAAAVAAVPEPPPPTPNPAAAACDIEDDLNLSHHVARAPLLLPTLASVGIASLDAIGTDTNLTSTQGVSAVAHTARVGIAAAAAVSELALTSARWSTAVTLGVGRSIIVGALSSARGLRGGSNAAVTAATNDARTAKEGVDCGDDRALATTRNGTLVKKQEPLWLFHQALDTYTDYSVSAVNHVFSLAELFTCATWHLARTSVRFTLRAATETVQLLDGLFGSTETSRALSSLVQLIRDEINELSPTVEGQGLIGRTIGAIVLMGSLTKALTAFACLQFITARRTAMSRKLTRLFEGVVESGRKNRSLDYGFEIAFEMPRLLEGPSVVVDDVRMLGLADTPFVDDDDERDAYAEYELQRRLREEEDLVRWHREHDGESELLGDEQEYRPSQEILVTGFAGTDLAESINEDGPSFIANSGGGRDGDSDLDSIHVIDDASILLTDSSLPDSMLPKLDSSFLGSATPPSAHSESDHEDFGITFKPPPADLPLPAESASFLSAIDHSHHSSSRQPSEDEVLMDRVSRDFSGKDLKSLQRQVESTLVVHSDAPPVPPIPDIWRNAAPNPDTSVWSSAGDILVGSEPRQRQQRGIAILSSFFRKEGGKRDEAPRKEDDDDRSFVTADTSFTRDTTIPAPTPPPPRKTSFGNRVGVFFGIYGETSPSPGSASSPSQSSMQMKGKMQKVLLGREVKSRPSMVSKIDNETDTAASVRAQVELPKRSHTRPQLASVLPVEVVPVPPPLPPKDSRDGDSVTPSLPAMPEENDESLLTAMTTIEDQTTSSTIRVASSNDRKISEASTAATSVSGGGSSSGAAGMTVQDSNSPSGSLRDGGMRPDRHYPMKNLLRNLDRYSRFATAAYGRDLMILLGIGKIRSIHTYDQHIHTNHYAFSIHTGIPLNDIIHSSYMDPTANAGTTSAATTAPRMEALVHYVVIDRFAKCVVVALRGTLGLSDVLTDMRFDYADFRGGRVHAGMLRTAAMMFRKGTVVHGVVKKALNENPGFGLVLTGHSLGGGVSALMALEWSVASPSPVSRAPFVTSESSGLPPGRPIHCYSYGSPCVATHPMSLAARGLVSTLINGDDMVPTLSLGLIRDLKIVTMQMLDPANKGLSERIISRTLGLSTAASTASSTSDAVAVAEAAVRDEDFFWSVITKLRDAMVTERLYPVGVAYWVDSHETETVVTTGRATTSKRVALLRCDDVRDMFAEPRFSSRVISDHTPRAYEDALGALVGAVFRGRS